MRYYVEINGESSLDIQGLMIQSLPSISKPLMRSKQETIDGRDGDIVTKLGYSAYDKTLKIGLWGNYDINEVIAFFNQEGTITFSNEPDKYYRFTILNRDDYVSQLDKFRTCTIALHCQPYKYKLNEEAEELENEYVEQEGTSLSFNNSLVAPMNIDLKGNTLQNGTPTPSSPIPINNVSGDNQIVVSGKNLFDKDNPNIINNYIEDNTGNILGSNNARCIYIPCKANTNYTISKIVTPRFTIGLTDTLPTTNVTCLSYLKNNSATSLTIQGNANAKYLVIYLTNSYDATTWQNILDSIQIEVGQATTYEAYNGTTYNINLGELKGRGTIYNYSFNASSFTSGGNRTLCIPIEANTTYYITKTMVSNRFRICLSNDVPSSSSASVNEYSDVSTLTSTSITNTNYKYLNIFYWTNTDTYTEEQIYDSLSVYTTTPIELNKIGTYQDYIYKENDKWYLHKEIKKLDMSTITGWEGGNQQFYKTGFVSTYGISRNTCLCNIFLYNSTAWYADNYFGITGSNNLWIRVSDSTLTDANNVPTWLSNKGATMYGILATPTNTEITYTPLIEQLNAIFEAQSKAGTTNVNQVNNDAPFIITASVLSGTDSITLTNEGNATSKPTITITGSGVVGVYLENIQMFNISLGTNETIIIDTENMEAYYGSQLKNRQVTGDYSNFALQSGTNNLKFTGLVTNVEITNYNRWI